MRRKMPMPVTVGDCLLLHQMGYRVVVHDGKVVAVAKENKKKNGISRIIKYLKIIIPLEKI